jgi:hypothetical protein
VEQAMRRVAPEGRQFLALIEPGTVQELLARAETITDVVVKDNLYRRAVTQASFSGDFDKASEIIERLSTEAWRSNARESLQRTKDNRRYDEAWTALNKSDYERAASLMAEISPSHLRSNTLLLRGLIGQLYAKNKPQALEIFDEHKRQAANIESGTERALWLIELASIAANMDVNRGFEDMELAIAEFNRAGFVPELEKYQEIEVPNESGRGVTAINLGLRPLFNYWTLQWLGLKDFDRALILAQQFQMREASALVQLAACRGVLIKFQQETPKREAAPVKQQ